MVRLPTMPCTTPPLAVSFYIQSCTFSGILVRKLVWVIFAPTCILNESVNICKLKKSKEAENLIEVELSTDKPCCIDLIDLELFPLSAFAGRKLRKVSGLKTKGHRGKHIPRAGETASEEIKIVAPSKESANVQLRFSTNLSQVFP